MGEQAILDKLNVCEFAECVGTRFRVYATSVQAMDLELTEATSLGSAAGRTPLDRDPFSLIFRGELQPNLPQQIYKFEHDRLGTLEMFIVPIGPDDQGMLYQAIFT